jgi:hypothetical protein
MKVYEGNPALFLQCAPSILRILLPPSFYCESLFSFLRYSVAEALIGFSGALLSLRSDELCYLKVQHISLFLNQCLPLAYFHQTRASAGHFC